MQPITESSRRRPGDNLSRAWRLIHYSLAELLVKESGNHSVCVLRLGNARIIEEAVEQPFPNHQLRLPPHEVFGKQEALIAKPEDKLILQQPPLVAMALAAVVEDKAAAGLEDAVDLSGDGQEGAGIPLPFVLLAIAVLRLAVVWGR